MNVRETLQIIVRARREGVILSPGSSRGKLAYKADRPLSPELIAMLREHKAEILALLTPPSCASLAVERAKRVVARLREFGFGPYLDDQGVLLIADATGRKRDASKFMNPTLVFDQLVAGLADDPKLLDP